MGSRGWFDIGRADLTLEVQCMGRFRKSELQVSVCWIGFD